jgi:Mg2+-importing ATPase
MSSVFDFLTFGLLLWSSVTVVDLTFAIPYLPGASVLGFTPLPATAMLSLAAVVTLYVASTEVLKANFYRRHAA